MSLENTIIELADIPAYANENDYAENGLLMCGTCREPKQMRRIFNFGTTTKPMVVRRECACERRAKELKEAKEAQAEKQRKANDLRIKGIQDEELRQRRFERSDKCPELEKCKRYSDSWPRMLENNIGLLIYGDTGNGKTHAAACIANALIDECVPVMMTSFPRILSGGFDKSSTIAEMNRYPLVVIDDLGAERQSDYSLEIMYLIIDERYKAKKPLIITTNLELEEIQHASDLAHKRIYERITEMCVPILFQGESRRARSSRAKLAKAKDLLGL